MAFVLIKIALSIGAFACFSWSFLILFSDKYFAHWQNTHWKEENDEQWSAASVKLIDMLELFVQLAWVLS